MTRTTLRTALVFSLATLMLAGCGPKRPDVNRNQRKIHSAHRGLAFTRLVVTFNEANALARAAQEGADSIAATDPEDPTAIKAAELAEETRSFADDIEWSLANTQKMFNHRRYMDKLWNQYTKLFPEEQEMVDAYRSGDLRTYRFQFEYRRAYKANYGIKKAEPRWEDLKPVIRKFYETDDSE